MARERMTPARCTKRETGASLFKDRCVLIPLYNAATYRLHASKNAHIDGAVRYRCFVRPTRTPRHFHRTAQGKTNGIRRRTAHVLWLEPRLVERLTGSIRRECVKSFRRVE